MKHIWYFGRVAERIASIAAIGALAVTSVVIGDLTQAAPAQATGTVSAPVNTAACPANPPTLVNGSFENFSNPATDATVATGTHTVSSWPFSTYVYGTWHGYGTEGPDQILFLKPSATPASGETPNFVTGWRSTSPMIEIQRQVGDYTTFHWPDGTLHSVTGGTQVGGVWTRNGVSSASRALNAGYYDSYGPQAGRGAYWAELNAVESSALYQDVTLPANARIFWSLLNRGRTNSNEEMMVKIGLASGTPAQQTSFLKYVSSNADKFSGAPVFDGSYTAASRIIGNLSDGWIKYSGTYDPDGSALAGTNRTIRLQFESITGGNGWPTFGNLLDDIQLTPFYACPVTRNLHVGQTETVNTLNTTYGIDQSLDVIGNPTASASEFNVSTNSVSFTPTQTGTFTVDYQMAMTFAGTTYNTASRITYNVSASPIVTYDPQGGTVSTTSEVVPLGNSMSGLSMPTPTRVGYTFGGWWTGNSSGSEVTPSYASSTYPTSDTTLFARWIPVTYSVTYDSQGGSAVAPGTYDHAGSVTLAPAPTKPGYTFSGWYLAPAGGSALGNSYTPSQYQNLVFYAQWTPEPTLTNLVFTGQNLALGILLACGFLVVGIGLRSTARRVH